MLGNSLGRVEIKVPMAYPREIPAGLWVSKCVTWELIRNADSWVLLRPIKSEALGVELSNLFLNKPSR